MYISICPVRAEIFNRTSRPKPDSPVQNRTPGNVQRSGRYVRASMTADQVSRDHSVLSTITAPVTRTCCACVKLYYVSWHWAKFITQIDTLNRQFSHAFYPIPSSRHCTGCRDLDGATTFDDLRYGDAVSHRAAAAAAAAARPAVMWRRGSTRASQPRPGWLSGLDDMMSASLHWVAVIALRLLLQLAVRRNGTCQCIACSTRVYRSSIVRP